MSAPALDPYVTFADRILRTGLIADPWVDGAPRFRAAPVVVSASELAELHAVAEAVTAVYDEAARLAASDPSVMDDFLVLTPCQKLMALASQSRWHGIARADVFRTTDGGLSVCEINSDTPTGEPEAVVLGGLAAGATSEQAGLDPNVDLERRFVAMVDATAATVLRAGAPRTVGIVYPTDMPEDLPLVQLYQSWLGARGYDVVLGSPFNLGPGDADGPPLLLGVPCPLIVRHYKTDWWGERLPVWKDAEPFADPLPLVGPLAALLDAVARGSAAVVNPFGSVVTQNKRIMALMWEQIDRFSDEARRTIRAHVPFTVRLEAMHAEQLSAEREAWVLKSDYGCEGDEVVVGRETTQAEWDTCLALAVPERWVVQRYFEVERTDAGESVNYGVFVIAGQATGLYARVQRGATNVLALSAPAWVSRASTGSPVSGGPSA